MCVGRICIHSKHKEVGYISNHVFFDGILGGCFSIWSKDVVVRSFCVVGVAEIFDKTWFVALICALSYGKKISFWVLLSGFFYFCLVPSPQCFGYIYIYIHIWNDYPSFLDTDMRNE